MAEVAQTWEEKLVRTQEVQKEREAALEALGVSNDRPRTLLLTSPAQA
jgi:kinesin family protein 1